MFHALFIFLLSVLSITYIFFMFKMHFLCTIMKFDSVLSNILVHNPVEQNICVCLCVCSNANPLHYYVLRVPRKVDRWR